MIKVHNLNYGFGTEESNILRRVSLEFATGTVNLICGPTGSGKSTLLKAIAQLNPKTAESTGVVWINDFQISQKRPNQIAHLLGYVNQQPESAFVAETVIEEIAFGMEQLGISASQMRENVNRVSELLNIAELLDFRTAELSEGQQQRVAIAAALAAGQTTLLLDEPTSALDQTSAMNLLKTLRHIADSTGTTILLSEHRYDRALPFADSIVVLKGDGSAAKLPATLDSIGMLLPEWISPRAHLAIPTSKNLALRVKDLEARYSKDQDPVISNFNLELRESEIATLEGPNGSGKTTALLTISGVLQKNRGEIEISGSLALVPQRASDLLFLDTLAKEFAESDRHSKAQPNHTSGIFAKLVGRVDPKIHPRDLSVGQQLALVIAIQLATGSNLILLDEPTKGFDFKAKQALAQQLAQIASSGTAVLLATHDSDFAAQIAANRYELLQGQIRKRNEASR